MDELEGLVINAMDYKEKSRILYLLTSEGKASLLVNKAKNYKDGLVNICQNLTLISYLETGKDLKKATYINAIDYYDDIKNDIKKMSVASYVLELIYKVDYDHNSDILYKMVKEFLENVKRRDDLFFLLLEFRIKMLYFLGIKPGFGFCSCCGTKNNLVGLSVGRGGMECVNCESKDNIGVTATKLISLIYSDKEFSLTLEDSDAIKSLSDIIDSYYNKYFLYELKSVEMLKTLKLY